MPRRTPRFHHITRAVPLRAAPVSLFDGMAMKNHDFDYKSTLTGLGLIIPICLGLWLLAVPTTMSLTTFAVIIMVMLAGSMVALTTWNNGRAARSIAHVLNDVEKAAPRE